MRARAWTVGALMIALASTATAVVLADDPRGSSDTDHRRPATAREAEQAASEIVEAEGVVESSYGCELTTAGELEATVIERGRTTTGPDESFPIVGWLQAAPDDTPLWACQFGGRFRAGVYRKAQVVMSTPDTPTKVHDVTVPLYGINLSDPDPDMAPPGPPQHQRPGS